MYSILKKSHYFVDFLNCRAEICQILMSISFLIYNLRHQKFILKLTDLYNIRLILICSSLVLFYQMFSISCLKRELLSIKNTRFTIEYKSLYSILSDFLYKLLFEEGAFIWTYIKTYFIVERAIHEIWGFKASLFVDIEIRKISSI